MKKILVTGISGFVGSFLTEYLLNCPTGPAGEVFGTFLDEREFKNIRHIQNKIKLFKNDITSKDQISDLISKIKPDQVIHLAAIASAYDRDREKVFKINVRGTLNLLEGCKNLKNKVRILLASTGYIYGSNTKDSSGVINLFTEDDDVKPIGIYAESKLKMEQEAKKFLKYKNLEIIITRAFSHTGPRQAPLFVIPAFCQQIAEIEKGNKKEELAVGNTETVRDFSDVRDVIRAYRLILNKGKSGEIYNIASGKGYLIKDVLTRLLTLSKKKISIKRDIKRYRRAEIEISIGSFEKLNKLTGWRPEIDLNKTLEDTLNYWRGI
jgi:GDP-4-dehydro-6-deoxy-D-mannose reductase